MIPIISIVGKSKSGKTTLIEKLIQELTLRGYRVATIKHTPKGTDFGESGKDNWRHLKAGSIATATISPDKIVLVKPIIEDISLNETAHLFADDYDIILTEGFKKSDTPKIEVHRKEIGPPLTSVNKLIAIATDEPLSIKTRQLSLEDIKGLTDLLEHGFIIPQREQITLYVNHLPISFSTFPKELISNVLLAIVSTLKGVGEVRNLKISLRRETKRTPKNQ
jgi:molybdopterin-guanine dinucleotide biosynthesis protein B